MPDKYLISKLSTYRARINENKEAIYDYDNGVRYSYGDIEKRANKLASFLINKLKLHKSDRIAFCAQNSVEFIDAFYASCKTGIIVTTYNCLLKENDLTNLINNEEPKVIFYDSKFDQTINSLKLKFKNIVYIRLSSLPNGTDDFCYQDIMNTKTSKIINCEDLTIDDIQLLIHTGGTTGTPKAAKISYRSIFFNSLSEVLTLGLNDKDCVYVFLPFFHTAAWNVLTLPILLSGGRVIITSKFNPHTALKIIREERPTVAMGVETIYKSMAEHEDIKNTDFSCYRWMLSGAASISKDTMEKYWDKGVKLVNAYGMTEIGPSNLAPPVNDMTLEEIKNKWNSVGKPMYFNNVRIVNDDGIDVEEGVCGELIWNSNLIFSGYYNNDLGTAEVMKDGWVYTGDIGRRDKDGFYYIVGRKKNMYISGGENIFPVEIEMAIKRYPAIEEVCVIGVKDSKWGEVGKALIVLKKYEKIVENDFKQYLKKALPSIKVPKYIEFVSEIPKNQVGKLDMQEIKQIYGTI